MLDACGLLGLLWWMAVILLALLVLSAVQSSCSYPHPSYDQGGYFDSTLWRIYMMSQHALCLLQQPS